MFCSNCGNKLPDNAKFCTECGAKIASAESQPTQQPASAPAFEPVAEKTPVYSQSASQAGSTFEPQALRDYTSALTLRILAVR